MIKSMYKSLENMLLAICNKIISHVNQINSYLTSKIVFFRYRSIKKSSQLDVVSLNQLSPSHTSSTSSLVFIRSDTWIDFYISEKKNIDYFTYWSNIQFPRRKFTIGRRRKTLVIDLDETLVHTVNKSAPNKSANFDVELVVENQVFHYYVFKRPHVDYFLQKVAAWFNLAFFTASMSDYADPVIEWLTMGVRSSVSKKLFRNSCVNMDGVYLKNLSLIEPDLSQVFIVDNSVAAFELNPDNGILINTWIDDMNDEALLDSLPFLDALRFVEDVRSILSLRKIKKQ